MWHFSNSNFKIFTACSNSWSHYQNQKFKTTIMIFKILKGVNQSAPNAVFPNGWIS